VNSLDRYRKYEMTMGWEEFQSIMGNQVLIAHRNARFLRAYIDQYRLFYLIRIFVYFVRNHLLFVIDTIIIRKIGSGMAV